MAYIGRDISNLSDRAVLDNITASATATYNLLLNSVAFVPSSAESLTVSLNGVIQKPQSSYTVSGSTIVFDSALTSSDVIDFIIAERAITLTTVGTGTITPDKLASSVKSAVIWQSSVKTSSFTASSNEGYWVDTSSNTVTITFPSSASVGDTIELVDYAQKWETNKIIINPNGLNYQGSTSNVEYTQIGQAVRAVYSGATKGWIPVSVDGDNTAASTYDIDFLVIGAGGGGGSTAGGGGGAGGYRNSYNNETSGGNSSSESAITASLGTQYTVTIGAGGIGGGFDGDNGTNGNDSVFATITSLGGGKGSHSSNGGNGGSGGGGGYAASVGGSGTTGQGLAGGNGGGTATPELPSGGGGGAGAVGANTSGQSGGAGGNGLASSITGSSVTRAGGGGGNGDGNASGGSGGGGQGGGRDDTTKTAGTANTGSGGGGGDGTEAQGNGGSGIVILRMATARYSGTTTGSPSVTTSGSDTILTYTGSGSYTA